MKNILVPIGTSSNSHETLQYAVDFASEFGAKIFVMDVFSVAAIASLANLTDKAVESSKDRIKEVIGKVDAKKVDIKMATYKGGIADGLKSIDNELGIDLIIIAAKSSDIKEELYLGNTSGKIIKQTDIPTLIVPKEAVFTYFETALAAFRSGILKRNRILNPLLGIKNKFKTKVSLLLVKTPGYTDDDLKVNTALMDISTQLTLTDNATTYQGVLEHIQLQQPDLLCVFRRKRGFLKKLWEKNTILKSEFFVKIPVLILSVKKY